MPRVWYPFPADHVHAGKYFEGHMPVGMLPEMLELSGAVTKKPKDALIVTIEQTILAEVDEAMDVFKTLPDSDQKAVYEKTAKLHAVNARAFAEAGNIKKAMAAREQLEHTVRRAGGHAGGGGGE